jgi:hypothetical protein
VRDEGAFSDINVSSIWRLCLAIPGVEYLNPPPTASNELAVRERVGERSGNEED